MKINYSKILAVFLLLAILLPVLFFLFNALPGNGISFWEFIERFSQWKPAFLKGPAIVVFFVFFLALLGVFIFVSKKELDK
jgi:uncharacterized BrkB/YihY/UPF0761 family membrane protein